AQRPVELTVCADPVTLQPGRHTLVAPAGRLFNPTAAYLGRPLASGASGASGEVPVQAVSWGSPSRTVWGPGDQAPLRGVPENASAGWQAAVNGRALPALRVDGWQQGWLVPAGTSGRVTLRYAPDRLYRLSLLAGLLGVVLLLGLALLPEGRPG